MTILKTTYRFIRPSVLLSALATAACGSQEKLDWYPLRDHLDANLSSKLLVGEWESNHVFTLSIDENGRYEVCATARGFGAKCSGGYAEYRDGFGLILLNFSEGEIGERILHMTAEINSPRTRRDLRGLDIPRGSLDFSPNLTGDEIERCRYNPCTLLGRAGGDRLLFRLKTPGRLDEADKEMFVLPASN